MHRHKRVITWRGAGWRWWLKRSALGLLAMGMLAWATLWIVGCVVRPPKPNSVSLAQRVAAFPTLGLALRGPARVYWNAHQMPFIEASEDADVPYVLGMVHAHLRLGQMELVRRISRGELSKTAGPLPQVVDIDHTLRALNFGKAAEEIEASLREDTREWLTRYVEGINAYREHAKAGPVERGLLGIADEAWTLRDVITIGRLAGTDITWGSFYAYMTLEGEKGWTEAWERMRTFAGLATPSFGGEAVNLGTASAALGLTNAVGKTGSNSWAVRGGRTASGSALISNDPHVGFTLPALWCQVAFKSPSFHVSGLSIPGLPFVLLGRNASIAWGGTNMQAVSSSVYDVTKLEEAEFTTVEALIERRWWFDTTRTYRQSPLGPVLTDAPMFKRRDGRKLALKWRGHEASDEFSAFLDVSRAANWEQFREAFRPYAVSGQNFLYADAEGNIGQLLALEFQPAAGRTSTLPVADPANPEHRWAEGIKSTDLPSAFNPEAGFLVSTNNTPVRTNPPLILSGNWNDRQERISGLLADATGIDWRKAVEIQRDVYAASSHALAQVLAARGATLPRISERAAGTLREVGAWDGRYRADSRGAYVFQALVEKLGSAYYAERYSPKVAENLLGSPSVFHLLREDVEAGLCDEYLAKALDATAQTTGGANGKRVWGDIHRLAVNHWAALTPYFGRPYQFRDDPIDGSLTTVFKSANDVTSKRHNASYGANARQVMDLSDMDATYLAILGGQDGWLGSVNFLDQYDAYRSGELIHVPMSVEAVRAGAAEVTELAAEQ